MRLLCVAFGLFSALSQGAAALDITVKGSGIWLELPHAEKPDCRLVLRSNQPAATALEFEALAKLLVVEEEQFLGNPILEARVSSDSLSYPLGWEATLIRIRSADLKPLDVTILKAFSAQQVPNPVIPKISAVLVDCE